MNAIINNENNQAVLEDAILHETDSDKLDEAIALFNLYIRKKDIIRAGKLNDLQDKITEHIGQRIESNVDQFSNKDLLDYFKTIQDTIDKSNMSVEDIETPAIQLNQVNINMGDELTIESRRRVLDAVNQILKENKAEDIQKLEESSAELITEHE